MLLSGLSVSMLCALRVLVLLICALLRILIGRSRTGIALIVLAVVCRQCCFETIGPFSILTLCSAAGRMDHIVVAGRAENLQSQVGRRAAGNFAKVDRFARRSRLGSLGIAAVDRAVDRIADIGSLVSDSPGWDNLETTRTDLGIEYFAGCIGRMDQTCLRLMC